MAQSERLLSAAEAAVKLGLRKRTFLRRVEAGEIPYVRKLDGLRGAYLFEASVIDVLARQTKKTSTPSAST